MTFFESLLGLMLAAIVLLQVSRRLALPYPAMLASAGVVVAIIPGAPVIPIDPHTTLALFIAPALVDAAFDFPFHTAKRYWRPLVALALVGVVVTTALVAWLGWMFAGLPLASAIVLGAIVAPPDAAAATATMSNLSLPRTTDAVLKGESLFNDATALLIFSAALSIQSRGTLDIGVATQIGLAIPGGILLGYGAALVAQRLNKFVVGTLGGNLLQFVNAFLLWLIAERLHLSAVLCIVTFSMTLASSSEVRGSARMRVHSFAVWSAVVFVLNVFAFLIMGMQARTIVERLSSAELVEAVRFAGLVVVACIVARMIFAVGFNRWTAWRAMRAGEKPPAKLKQAILVGWSGMRGLVTLATAFALPETFPKRDLVVLTAFAVVLATLVVQGLTLAPLVRLLGLDRTEDAGAALWEARRTLGQAALASLADADGAEAERLRCDYAMRQKLTAEDKAGFKRQREVGLAAVAAERDRLDAMQMAHEIGPDAYLILQEELDWRELTLLPDEERRIEAS